MRTLRFDNTASTRRVKTPSRTQRRNAPFLVAREAILNAERLHTFPVMTKVLQRRTTAAALAPSVALLTRAGGTGAEREAMAFACPDLGANPVANAAIGT